ncbi:MAG: hypothetical protein ACTSX6_10835 [Candidatus Heimdallarchaeaceae archaeon]
MDSDRGMNDSLDEKIKKIEKIAERLLKNQLFLPMEFSSSLMRLEKSLLEGMECGWEIDTIIEDGRITQVEGKKLELKINQLLFVVEELAKNHPENVKVINEVVNIINSLEDIISRVQYTTEFKGTSKVKNEKGYVVLEKQFFKAIEQVSHLLLDEMRIKKGREISKIERELINTAKILGKMYNKITFNVVYIELTILMKEMINAIEILKLTIEPIYALIEERYYLEKIRKAKKIFKELSSNKILAFNEKTELKGILTRKRKRRKLKELSEFFSIKKFE